MTADERIEKLMNRFGQTISDLPDRRGDIPDDLYVNTLMKIGQEGYQDCVRYALHLTDMIDRMETAMHNSQDFVPAERASLLDYSQFNAFVARKMHESGLNQRQFAIHMGVYPEYIFNAVHNTRKMPDRFYRKIYEAHGEDFDEHKRLQLYG